MKSLIAFTSLVLSTQVFAKNLDQVMREKTTVLNLEIPSLLGKSLSIKMS